MRIKEKRRNFLINKPFQFRYMASLSLILFLVTLATLVSVYFGIWGEVLDAFSDEKIQADLLMASRLQQYEEARTAAAPTHESFSTLSWFRQAERLSDRQRDIFKEILNRTHRRLIEQLLLLFVLVALGTIFLSHKIAGPLYRFETILYQMGLADFRVRCQLRKFDEAKSVAQSFNRTLELLDQKISELKKILQEDARDPERLLSRLREKLSEFKTSADR